MVSPKRSKWYWTIILSIGLLCLVIAGLQQVSADSVPVHSPEPKPLDALRRIAWNSAVITTTTNCTAQLTQGYSYHDLFCTVEFSDTQSIDVYMETSPDNSHWYTTTSLLDGTAADTEVFTRAMSYAKHERLVIVVETDGVEVTPTCQSVYFNNWTPAELFTAW